jgi:hypothetical protein
MTQQPLNFRNKPLADEMRPHFLGKHELNKRHYRKLLLEWRISEYNQQQQQEVDRARSW